MFALQCCQLLTKSQVFQKESATIAEESQNRTDKEPHDVYHASLLSYPACGQQLCVLLKSKTDRISARHKLFPPLRELLSARNDSANNFGPSLRQNETPVEALKPKELTVRSTY